MTRKFPRKGLSGPAARAVPGLTPTKPKIIIVCEGKVTEPRYFDEFTDHHGNSLVSVTTIGGCGVPVCVVERAIEEKRSLAKIAKSTKDSFDKRFEVWAVFDRDAHPRPQVPQALELARNHGIHIAYSNPCFEIWGLMHFSCAARPGSHQQTQRQLKQKLDGYCHDKNPVFNFEILAPKYNQAVTNAQQALRDREMEGNAMGDPCTLVHMLTEKIKYFGAAQKT